ncbi:MAG: hypothetical protein IPI67_30455 [Myxococcales bacterium]|nr:hypothetical protein [Myxococcales bacterium]
MTTLGNNTKWTIAAEHRDSVRRILTEGLGLASKPGPSPDFDLYVLADGGMVGVAFVDRPAALDDSQQAKSAWLEFAVDDAERRTDALAKLGALRVDYTDKAHAYFQIPGGPIFRLKASA